MIYVYTTKNKWKSTNQDDVGQIPIAWNRYILRYWDSKIRDYVDPMFYHRSRGFTRPPDAILLKMWVMGDNFPRFDTGKIDDIHKIR